ncbi:MAG: hypothetical protein K1X92_09555 [Bacteroidia bacterium]|nr:hypothetical protein [Bacteroidia bacterium]
MSVKIVCCSLLNKTIISHFVWFHQHWVNYCNYSMHFCNYKSVTKIVRIEKRFFPAVIYSGAKIQQLIGCTASLNAKMI